MLEVKKRKKESDLAQVCLQGDCDLIDLDGNQCLLRVTQCILITHAFRLSLFERSWGKMPHTETGGIYTGNSKALLATIHREFNYLFI